MAESHETNLGNGSGSDSESDSDEPEFMDKDEPSDDDTQNPPKKIIKPIIKHKRLFGERPITDYFFANAKSYNFKTWVDCFPDKNVNLRSLLFNSAWDDFFDIVGKKPYYKKMERILSDYLLKDEQTILPHAELVFNSMNILSPRQIKVIFLGQDPYIGIERIDNKPIPQAMGFSFSVPLNCPKAKSLQNIYANLLDFGHVSSIPRSGCLIGWILQGCFMINSAFTTFFGKSNAHASLWQNFTADLLAYLNNKHDHLVFLAWGKNAHQLCLKLDPTKHHIITSSHPSPFSYENTYTGFAYGKTKNPNDRSRLEYPSFKSTNHFGRINQYLRSVGKSEILWDLIDF